MAIEIRQEEVGDVRVLVLAGRLDTETAADLELALQDLQAAGASRFVIDLAEIGYVSSAGLRVLLALAKQLEGGRGSLRLCALNESVKQVFDVAGFSRLFAIFPDRDAALGGPAAAKPEAGGDNLARSAAGLLGAGEGSAAASDADAQTLARAAAHLLGAEKPAAEKPPSAAKPKAAPAKPAAPAPAPAPSPQEAAGVLGKFRGLFGKK
jgi:anti-sigma B factor antagonist